MRLLIILIIVSVDDLDVLYYICICVGVGVFWDLFLFYIVFRVVGSYSCSTIYVRFQLFLFLFSYFEGSIYATTIPYSIN